jgi:hypothetical protein
MRYHASMPRLIALTLAILFCAPLTSQQPKEASMPHHAQGTFTVDIKPLSPAPADGLSRFSIDKQIHGDLQGIAGTFTIDPSSGKHLWTLDYTLPE